MSNIVVKRFHHYNLWVFSKLNMEHLTALRGENKDENLEKLARFLIDIVYGRKVPHRLFNEEVSKRVSSLTVPELPTISKQNSSFKWYVIEGLKRKETSRHYSVLSCILEKDPNSIASEVPVWQINPNIVGHIDLITFDKGIKIWDYKPDGEGLSQVLWYRRLLGDLLRVDENEIRIGWFNQEYEYLVK